MSIPALYSAQRKQRALKAAKRKAKAARLRKARQAPTVDGRTISVPARATHGGEEEKLKRQLHAVIRAHYGPTCISCRKDGLTPRVPRVGGNWEAGHLFAVGPYPALKFHPLNIASQCSYCNGQLRGNHAAYSAAFIRRHGIATFEAMDAIKGQPRKFAISDLIELRQALTHGGLDGYSALYFTITGWCVERAA